VTPNQTAEGKGGRRGKKRSRRETASTPQQFSTRFENTNRKNRQKEQSKQKGGVQGEWVRAFEGCVDVDMLGVIGTVRPRIGTYGAREKGKKTGGWKKRKRASKQNDEGGKGKKRGNGKQKKPKRRTVMNGSMLGEKIRSEQKNKILRDQEVSRANPRRKVSSRGGGVEQQGYGKGQKKAEEHKRKKTEETESSEWVVKVEKKGNRSLDGNGQPTTTKKKKPPRNTRGMRASKKYPVSKNRTRGGGVGGGPTKTERGKVG